MNKKSGQRTPISKRLFALLLCCVCLVGVMPLAAIATRAEETQPVTIAENATTEAATETATEGVMAAAETEPTGTEPGDTLPTETVAEETVPSGTEAGQETEAAETTEPSTEPSDPTETTAPAETEETVDPVKALYDSLMECTTLEQVNAILNPETEEEQAAVDALVEQFSEEQQQALMAHMAGIGYYDGETLDNRNYTITQGNSQYVSVDNMQSDGFSYSCSPAASGIKVTARTYGGYTGYTISVDGNVTPSTYTLTVKYKTKSGPWYYPTTTEHTDTVTITVKKQVTGNQYSQQDYANPDFEHVAWDVVGSYNNGKPSGGKDNATSYVESVEMANKAVEWAESDTNYAYNGKNSKRAGRTLDTYFGKDVTSSTASASITLSITPKPGYYITGYWIVCCNGSTPYNCAVMRDGNEHSASFTFADSGGGTVEATVWSEYFGHPDSRDDQYFIIVAVSPIPTPLFVDYDYGIIKDEVEETEKSIFTTPTSWTTTTAGNNYGTGKIDTSNTQYRYTYSADKPAEASKWKHYANSVTEEAKNAAWNAGYYFAGWKAEYYTDAKDSQVGNDSDGKSYNYNFTGKYASEVNYQEGAEVNLLMHVKLTAQWLPIELKLTKNVTGLTNTDFASDTHTYKIQLQKKLEDGTWQDLGTPQELSVTGDGSTTITMSPVTPGTYRAVEVEESRGNLTKNGKTMYVTVTDSGEVTYGTTPGATSQNLTVTNDYTATAPTATLTITKRISGNMLSKNDEFTFTVTGTSVADADKSFTLKDGETKKITVNIGDTITIEEATGSYTTTYQIGENGTVENGSSAKIENIAEDTTITFTNTKEVTIDTGISLETLPYILILAVVAVGAVVMIRKRRNRDED